MCFGAKEGVERVENLRLEIKFDMHFFFYSVQGIVAAVAAALSISLILLTRRWSEYRGRVELVSDSGGALIRCAATGGGGGVVVGAGKCG